MSGSRINAYQLSLLGDAPKPMRAWRRPFYVLRLCGLRWPLEDNEIRQNAMLTPDTHSFAAVGAQRGEK